jgi:DNA polymerase elongation subunit (family B)
MVAKKEGDKATNSGLKLALNGAYGKSNDAYSLFYDPMYTMKITINGQLLLSMLAEKLVDRVKDITVLQINTDGITIKIPRTQYPQVTLICEDWEETTDLILEFAEYKTMVIRDVNNYLAETTDGYAKPKGVFEIIPMQNGAIAYNKNWSMRIVPKALHAHYLAGIDIEKFIRNHDNIYDFALSFRARPDWNIFYTEVEGTDKEKIKQQRTVRYYASKSGGALTKEHKLDGRVVSIEAGKPVTMFNKFVDKQDYNIDYNYYIARANKIMNAVDDGQLKLF